MELKHKPDFGATRELWHTFWADSERLPHPMVHAIIPKPGITPAKWPPKLTGAEQPDDIARRIEAWASTHDFLGAAVPFFSVQFGPMHFAGLLGCELVAHPGSAHTTWARPFVSDWAKAELRFQKESALWERTVNWIRQLRARLDGSVIVVEPTLSANLDALAAARGVEQLLADIVLDPEAIHHALAQVTRAHGEVAKALRDELAVETWGSVTRHGLYSPGMLDVLQCDFSCMIGEDTFNEFVLPYLAQEAEHLDCAEYHLDGPGAIRHLNSIASIEKVAVIQWQPGAGEAASKDWSGLQRKIDSLCKGQILKVDIEKVPDLWRSFRSRRLVFYVDGLSASRVGALLDSCATPRATIPPREL